jgi:hypothetical protein
MKTTHPWLWRFLPALLVVAVLAFFLYLRKGEQPPSHPARLGEMGLAEQFEGATAQWMIDQLHGRGVTPRENIIGLYEGGGVRAALYVSGYADAAEADVVNRSMARRIGERNAVFVGLAELHTGGRMVSACTGMGQTHYFFASGSRLYWLAVDPPAAQRALECLLREAS